MIPAENDPNGQAYAGAFRDALRELGWTEGRNVLIDYRWNAGNPDLVQRYAAEVVATSPDVILANGTPATSTLRLATQNIPVVFVVVTDPVGAGFVQSLARPGGNITGFSTFEPEIGGKWLELLNEISPNLRRVAGLLDPSFKGFAAVWRSVENSASRLGITATNIAFHDPSSDIEPALATLAKDGMGGLIVLPTSTNGIARPRILSLAAQYHLPAVYPFRQYAADGGLMSYGFDPRDQFVRGASYVDRILRGERPADLPVQAPTKYDLIINLKTAKILNLTIHQSLLATASEVIE
jgi:putative ABC transport system substrate-binding protein